MVLVPLVPVWLVAMILRGSAWVPVAVVGVVTLVSAVLFARLLWRLTIHRPVSATSKWIAVRVVAIIACALLWVWLQYALNPFRMRGVFEALAMSRATPWQLASGFYLFGSVIFAGWFVRGRELSGEERKTVSQPKLLDTLSIRLADRTVLVKVSTVERLQGCDDHVAVVSNGRSLLASYRLAELESSLDANQFIRIHRSHIVNLAHVAAVERLDANRDVVLMKSGDRIAASRKGTATLRRRIHPQRSS
jgi:hypothetical protein